MTDNDVWVDESHGAPQYRELLAIRDAAIALLDKGPKTLPTWQRVGTAQFPIPEVCALWEAIYGPLKVVANPDGED
jgi:hypothetical protein